MIAKTRKQPRCPAVVEWLNKLGSIQTFGILASAKKEMNYLQPQNYMEEAKHLGY